MKRALTVLFLLAFAPACLAQTSTYRWVDDAGVVHYSDSPNPAAQDPEADRVQISTPNVIQSRIPQTRPVAGTSVEAREATPESQDVSYESVRIVSPGSAEVLWNIGGVLNVSVQTTPSLRPGHGVLLFLDGTAMPDGPVPSPAITMTDVWRGEHTLRAVVRGRDGKDLASSESITFYVQQTTIN